MSVKINTLELENVKRIKAIKLEVTANGLTVIGGKNGQGKTSVIDAIAWALGGNKYRPSEAQRNGSVIPPHLKITLDNGMIVERSGKNSTLKVVDPTGNKSGQQLLDSFISEFALDLPKFMSMTDKEKANVLLEIIGVGDKLHELEYKAFGADSNIEIFAKKAVFISFSALFYNLNFTDSGCLYNQRTEVGRIADRKKKYAEELPVHNGLPSEPVSAADLIRQQQDILARNGENQRKRDKVNQSARK